MFIVLRKINGVLTPLFRQHDGPSFGAGVPAGAVSGFLNSRLLMVIVAIAFAVAWMLSAKAGGGGPLHVSPLSLTHVGGLSVMGNLLTAKDLRQKRAVIAEAANKLLAAATGELSAEDQASFDAMHTDIERLGRQAESIERHEKVMTDLNESRGTVAGRQDSGVETTQANAEHDAKVEEAFGLYLRHGMEALEPEQKAILNKRYVRDNTEQRTAQTVTTSAGGYLIPQGFSDKLEESLKAYGGVAAAADSFDTETGNTLPYPTVDDTANTGRLLAINTAATETAVTYGVINFAAYKFSSDMVTVPVELLQDSAFNLDKHLTGVLATRLGRVHNTYNTTGTGSSQPQGIVPGSSSGLTAAGATSITYDELVELEHSVDPAYRNSAFGAGFMFNDQTLKKLRQMKDGEGKPLWQENPQVGAPNTINGWPYFINQDMAAMTTGLKPILFGALKKFMIRNVKGFTLLRLSERYAELHQVAFLAFTRMDSHVLDAGTDPMKYITMA